MKPYTDRNRDSGIVAYEYGDDWVHIQFKHGVTYEYLSSNIGITHFQAMKKLADSGDGLNAYINNHPEIKSKWSRKW